jgi:uncharacterized Ntn-hydrolase superfamily protein
VTFSLLGRCARTGQLGVAVTTSDIAVGARVPFAVAGLGVAATQHRTDPRLGPRALELLRSGCSPQEAIDATAASTADRAWRQVAILDAHGAGAAFTGDGVWPVAGAWSAPDALAVGNMLVGAAVGPAIVDGFAARSGEPLAARLIAGLRAGLDAGGETRALRSAAVLVVERESFPLVDLRIDDAADPLAALAALWEAYAPWTRDFVRRALDPDGATGRPDAGDAVAPGQPDAGDAVAPGQPDAAGAGQTGAP